jgi:hypothetical protein
MEARYVAKALKEAAVEVVYMLTDGQEMGAPDPRQLGLITAIYFIGCLCGSVPAQLITDRL